MKSPFSFSKHWLKFSGELEITRDKSGRLLLQHILTQLRSFELPIITTSYRLTAFSNESLSMDNFTIESSKDSIVLYGSIVMNLTNPKDISRFTTILHVLTEIEQILEKEFLTNSLPKKLQVKAKKTGDNPFY